MTVTPVKNSPRKWEMRRQVTDEVMEGALTMAFERPNQKKTEALL
jgi:hypothetical protein